MRILAARNVNNDIRIKSSSGGVFYALAEWVLLQGGKVIGAAYGDTAYDVKHVVVDKIDELPRLQKSKYAPSSMADPMIAETLKKAHTIWTLFSGTPCQVMAVHKKYARCQRLLLVEVACHGVPTKDAYHAFLKDNDIVRIDFRCKRNGWKNSGIEMIHTDGQISYQRSVDNAFYQDYAQGKNLRQSCLACPAKQFKSGADFTLADFWGVESFVPELDDDKGISLVFLHTKKSNMVWSEVAKDFVSRPVSFFEAVHWNPCVYRSVNSDTTIREIWEEKKFVIRQYWDKIFG